MQGMGKDQGQWDEQDSAPSATVTAVVTCDGDLGLSSIVVRCSSHTVTASSAAAPPPGVVPISGQPEGLGRRRGGVLP